MNRKKIEELARKICAENESRKWWELTEDERRYYIAEALIKDGWYKHSSYIPFIVNYNPKLPFAIRMMVVGKRKVRTALLYIGWVFWSYKDAWPVLSPIGKTVNVIIFPVFFPIVVCIVYFTLKPDKSLDAKVRAFIPGVKNV